MKGLCEMGIKIGETGIMQGALQGRIDWPACCIIDGSNVIRNHDGSVAGLATCYFAAKNAGCHVQVFLDANISHVLKDNGDDNGRELLDELLKNHNKDIQIVPAGVRADDFILFLADSNGSHVISNDRYLAYAKRYPWVEKGGRLHKLMFVDGHLLIPDFGVYVSVDRRDNGGRIPKLSQVPSCNVYKSHKCEYDAVCKGNRHPNNRAKESYDVSVSESLLERVMKALDWRGSNIKKFLRVNIKSYGKIFGQFSDTDDVLVILSYGFSHQEEVDYIFPKFVKMICVYHYEEYCEHCKELAIVRERLQNK